MMNNTLKTLLVLGSLIVVKGLTAAVPGASESFPTLENAESWAVFDYANETVYFPQWAEETDPYIYLYHDNDAALWFFTDEEGSSDWLGDYHAGDIQAIKTAVFIDSPEHFEQLDCAIFTNGPAGARYYCSSLYLEEDFPEYGWWTLTFDLETTWYYYDEGWVALDMTSEGFQEVEEIGFRFFPKEGITAELYAAIDEVRLEPLVEAPDLEFSEDGGNFVLQFTPRKANRNFIEVLSTDPSSWKAVPGQTAITGPGPHIFSTPISDGKGIFRVQAEPDYTQVDPEASH